MERILLPVTDLRVCTTHSLSTAALLRQASGLLFYHTKVGFLNRVLNNTAHRGPDESSPEISIDPLEALEGIITALSFTFFFQRSNAKPQATFLRKGLQKVNILQANDYDGR